MIINVENDEMLGRTNNKALHITLIEQQKEIEILKENNENMQIEMASCWEKIDKAIEELDVYINYCSIDGESYDVCNRALKCMIKARDILKGESNDI